MKTIKNWDMGQNRMTATDPSTPNECNIRLRRSPHSVPTPGRPREYVVPRGRPRGARGPFGPQGPVWGIEGIFPDV